MNLQQTIRRILREEDRYDDKVGKTFWFEYHCYESPESCDDEIWYRSHQKVKVIGVSEWSYDDKEWRQEDGNPRVYLVEWSDGYQYDVFEDELMESPDEFYRPSPPKRKIQETIRRILREELFDKKQNSQSDILTNFKNQDQEERNEYQKFVHSEFNGDYERAAKEYAKLKNRSFDDIFGDKERMEKFISIDFDFDGLSDEDWENYWLLSQHADTNPNFQKDALKTISQYLGKDNDNYKYLHDRISCRETGTQKYGTQNICKKYSLDNLQETIKRILREEIEMPTYIKRRYTCFEDFINKLENGEIDMPIIRGNRLDWYSYQILLTAYMRNHCGDGNHFYDAEIHEKILNFYEDKLYQWFLKNIPE